MQGYSVLMSVYARENAAHFRQAVESMLQQTIPPEAFVLVCDGPLTQELENVITELVGENPALFQMIRLPENRGLGIALQTGLLACRTEWVARMDADDIALPDRMEKQLAAVAEDPDLTVLGGQIGEFTQDPDRITGYRKVPLEHEKIRKWAAFRCPMNHMTVLMRRSHILEAGGYQHFLVYEDYHLWARLLARGYRLGNLPDVCCKVRVDDTFYARRGGWKYFQRSCRMQVYLRKLGLIGTMQFLRNIVVRFLGTVAAPEALRRNLYHRFLRKKRAEEECLWKSRKF